MNKYASASDYRAQQTLAAHGIPEQCGCPSTASTGADCLMIRTNWTSGACLCPCHRDAGAVAERELARRLVEGM